MVLVLLAVLAFSLNWAKWSDYVKPGEVKQDDTYPYYEKAHGCHKGYEDVTDGENHKCTKCKDLPGDWSGHAQNGISGKSCKDEDTSWKDQYGMSINCYCKDKKIKAGSCPVSAKGVDDFYKTNPTAKSQVEASLKKKNVASYQAKQCLFGGCMPYKSKARCSGVAVWAFIVVIVVAVLVVVVIVVVIIVVIIKLTKKTGTSPEKVQPGNTASTQEKPVEAASAPPAATSNAPQREGGAPAPVEGPYVLIKMGGQEKQTQKNASAVWGETLTFTGLGAEDDDVEIELFDGGLVGKTSLRIVEYVNTRKHASLTITGTDQTAQGVLELDIEVQVQEEPLKIEGIFVIDKYTKN